MKRLSLLVFSTFVFSFAYAQNWHVIPHNGSVFQPVASDWYYPVWIDSVSVSGNDSVFYFSRTIGYTPGVGQNEYNIKAASWAGYNARMNPDSVTFYNHAGLPIVLKPNASVHSSWTFCKTDTGLYFRATVDSIVSGFVLNQSDSIKYIRIQAYNSLNIPVANSNNITISLSKRNGLLKTFAFYSFLPVNEMTFEIGGYYGFYNVPGATLELSGNGTEGVTDFGWMDAFNYPENGVFCVYYEYVNFPPGGPTLLDKTGSVLSEISSKTIFGTYDSIAYTIHQCSSETDHLTDSVFKQEGDYIITIRPDSSLTNYQLIESKAGCTVFTNSSNHTAGIPLLYRSNGSQTSKLLPLECGLLTYDLSHDSIYGLPICDGDFPQNSYCRNWGGAYYDTYYYYNVSKHVLSYFTDGNISWGTPKTCSQILSLEESAKKNIMLYPNPAGDYINCMLPDNGAYEIVVYNALGSIVHPSTPLRMTIEDGIFQINISMLPSGIYFIESRGERVLRGKFVKQ